MSTPLGYLLASTPLALFDLDWTLLAGDSFLPFVISYALKYRRLERLPALAMYATGRITGILTAQQAKQGVIRSVFSGENCKQIAEHAESFCRAWLACRIRRDVHLELTNHLQAGHRVMLVSGSPDLYVTTFARILNIPEVVCTRVAQFEGKCTGNLASENCKGDAKLAMLKQHLNYEHPPDASYAYGDSRSDLQVLRWVSHGNFVKRWSGRIVSLADSRKAAGWF